MKKIIFEVPIVAMILMSSYGLFSKKYKAQIIENKINFSPSLISLIETLLFEAILMLMLLTYLNHYVGSNLAFGYFILEIVSCIVGNTYLYTDILADRTFFVLDKIIAIIEVLMLIKIGYVGLQRLEY